MRRRDREGANAVEFALVMPTFIILVFGMMEFSWAFFMRAGVINSVRSGCRDGSVVHPDDDPSATAEVSIQDNLQLYTIDCDDLNTVRSRRLSAAARQPSRSTARYRSTTSPSSVAW